LSGRAAAFKRPMTAPTAAQYCTDSANSGTVSPVQRSRARATAERADGRSARSARTQAAVIDALLVLTDEGDLRPTAARVALRAGVSLRTVFQHFQDMDLLYATAAERQYQRMSSLLTPPPPDGLLDQRIEAFVAHRARLLEAITPVRRAALLSEPFSDVLATRLRATRLLAQREVERAFAPELRALPPAGRREVASALTMATAWPAWESLRAHQRLGVRRARSVMARIVRALLKQEG
jgi:TetR/AcrR family transcriptional regulator, regulator of autoinduction and epiphytic fitness